MTIPKGTEQWECDLIAPSAAPGLTDAQADALMDDLFPLGPAVDRLYIYRALIRAGYAAGQAHPQRQGPPREPTEEMLRSGRMRRHSPTDELWRAMYDAAPAASQAAPAAVAEPSDCAACLQPEVWSVHSCGPPSAPQAQEPDALVQRLRFIGGGTTTEAADRIEQLQTQHEADAALIAELREYKAMYEGLCK